VRKIKFRAKDRETGEWVYSGKFGLAEFFYGIEDGQLDGETLGEYIGLPDKNGKEIYEGDWLKWSDNFFKIIYDTFNGCWYGEPHIDNPFIGILTARSFPKSEIIGNIYQDSHLLDKSEV